MKRSYFTYAVLGHKDTGDGWVTAELIKPTQILAESAEEIQMKVIRELTIEQMDEYEVKNLDIMVKAF